MKCNNCGFETPEQINFCPVCATEMIPSTPDINQTSEMEQEPDVNQTPEINSTTEVNQIPVMNSIPEIAQTLKDWFVGNVVLIVVSALATIASCCMNIFSIASLVLSIIGVVYSNKVKNSILNKNYDFAAKNSKTAKTLFFVSLGILIFSVMVTIALMIFLVTISINSDYSNSIFNT